MEKGALEPEKMHVGDGGHFCIMQSSIPASDYALMPDTGTETGSLSGLFNAQYMTRIARMARMPPKAMRWRPSVTL